MGVAAASLVDGGSMGVAAVSLMGGEVGCRYTPTTAGALPDGFRLQL